MKKKITIWLECAILLLSLGLVFSAAGCGKNMLAESTVKTESSEAETKASESPNGETTETEEPLSEEESQETAETESTGMKADAGVSEKEEELQETAETESAGTNADSGVLEKITLFETPKTMYALTALNVRRGPSTEYEVISHLDMAQAVEVTGQAETGWYQVSVGGVSAYASNRYLSETKVEIPVQPALSAGTESKQSAAAPAPAGVIMVGDSRCVQMQAAVGGGGCSWICENSKEYTWFSETAIPKFDQYVGKGSKVVINMGVNDPEHYAQYAELVNAKAAEWAGRGAVTYFVSVNPVWENPYTSQEEVDTFNANMPGLLVGVNWIDTSSWLTSNGYRLVDGLHYDDPTYVNIFNLIMGSL